MFPLSNRSSTCREGGQLCVIILSNRVVGQYRACVILMSSCVGGSKAPPGTISAIYTRYAGTISTSYKNFR